MNGSNMVNVKFSLPKLKVRQTATPNNTACAGACHDHPAACAKDCQTAAQRIAPGSEECTQ